MEKNGQIMIEQLMVYGLVVIILAAMIVLLMYVTGSPSGGVTCQSKSRQFIVDSFMVGPGAGGVDLTIRNATGKIVTVNSAVGEGSFSGTGAISGSPVQKSEVFAVTNIGGPLPETTFSDGEIHLNVTIGNSLTSDFNVICNGSV